MTKAEVLQKLQFEASIRGLSKNTQKSYYIMTRSFQNYFDKPATELEIKDIRDFLYYLLTKKGLSTGTVNKYNSVLRFLYNIALDTPIDLNIIPFHPKQRRYPEILTREEVNALFEACDNLRDKALFMTIYSAGLRLNEAAGLKVTDIDIQKMQIYIRDGKGKKDRYAILSQSELALDKKYLGSYPGVYISFAYLGAKPYASSSYPLYYSKWWSKFAG